MQSSIIVAVGAFIGAAPLVAQPGAAAPKARAPHTVFVAVLEGGYMTPPVLSHATGTAELVAVGHRRLRYDVRLDSITNLTVVSLHIGHAGAIAPAVATLATGPHVGASEGLHATGTLTARDLRGTTMHALLRALRENDVYVTVDTEAHPAGEARGQLRMQPVAATG